MKQKTPQVRQEVEKATWEGDRKAIRKAMMMSGPRRGTPRFPFGFA